MGRGAGRESSCLQEGTGGGSGRGSSEIGELWGYDDGEDDHDEEAFA